MKKSVSLYEAKTQLSTLLRSVEDGSVITITRHGKAVAELRPIVQKPQPRAGSLKSASFFMADDFDAPLPELAEYTYHAAFETARVAETPLVSSKSPGKKP